jgi:hypothetical protein
MLSAFAQPIARWSIVTPIRIFLSTVFLGGCPAVHGLCGAEKSLYIDLMSWCPHYEERTLIEERQRDVFSCAAPDAKA